MKQKIVIELTFRCEKCRENAMVIAARAKGVISVTMQGDDQDEILVVGNDVDSVGLCAALRKKLRHADLKSVEEVKPPTTPEENPADKKPEEKKPEEEEKKPPTPEAAIIYHPCPPYYPPPYYCYPNNPPQCHIYTTLEDGPKCTIM